MNKEKLRSRTGATFRSSNFEFFLEIREMSKVQSKGSFIYDVHKNAKNSDLSPRIHSHRKLFQNSRVKKPEKQKF